MPGRIYSGETAYRYGFNGMEKDDELAGEGNSYTTPFRQYDSRIGRWLSLDPMMAKYPYQSPYAAFNNNPIYFADPTGLEGDPKTHTVQKGETLTSIAESNDISIEELMELNSTVDWNSKIRHGKENWVFEGEGIVVPSSSGSDEVQNSTENVENTNVENEPIQVPGYQFAESGSDFIQKSSGARIGLYSQGFEGFARVAYSTLVTAHFDNTSENTVVVSISADYKDAFGSKIVFTGNITITDKNGGIWQGAVSNNRSKPQFAPAGYVGQIRVNLDKPLLFSGNAYEIEVIIYASVRTFHGSQPLMPATVNETIIIDYAEKKITPIGGAVSN
jgi:RHS repeat-associated protein